MATPGTNTRKTAVKAARSSTTEDMAVIAERHFQHRLDTKRILFIRVVIASGPILGPPPRPKKDAFHFHQRIAKDQVLSINSEILSGSNGNGMPTAKPKPIVGKGPRPQ